MTLFGDNIESGRIGLTSALGTRSAVRLERYHRFAGGGNQTWTGFLPYGTLGFNSVLYINSQGSGATTDRLTISTSGGATTLQTYTAFGSSQGILASSVVGLGTRTVVASACSQVGPNVEGADIPFQVILSSTDTATSYDLFMTFRRPFKPGIV